MFVVESSCVGADIFLISTGLSELLMLNARVGIAVVGVDGSSNFLERRSVKARAIDIFLATSLIVFRNCECFASKEAEDFQRRVSSLVPRWPTRDSRRGGRAANKLIRIWYCESFRFD